MSTFKLVCAGCGTPAPAVNVDPFPFHCRNATAAPDTDHVVTKMLNEHLPGWPDTPAELNPFIRYRDLLYSHDVAVSSHADPEQADRAFVRVVEQFDDAVFGVSGQHFRITPFARQDALSDSLGFDPRGGVWVKDETGNVSGSHKARHLAGIMLYLLQCARGTSPLAIASCGNAALAAAVVARAAGWPLRAFVPPHANPALLQQLQHFGAATVPCPRQLGKAGDPCYLRFKEALERGALPFCCQGSDNGLTIEGGETLVYEMIDQLGDTRLDAIVVQVGGGALASACVQGFERAVALRRLPQMPRICTVQTQSAAPLARAFDRLAPLVRDRGIDDAVAYAASHRSEFMWPWEHEPRSVAHGILDDETYDWLAVVRGMLETGGHPVVMDEHALVSANRQARDTTTIDVDHTGSAGLAGLQALLGRGEISLEENVAVIFSGVQR